MIILFVYRCSKACNTYMIGREKEAKELAKKAKQSKAAMIKSNKK